MFSKYFGRILFDFFDSFYDVLSNEANTTITFWAIHSKDAT